MKKTISSLMNRANCAAIAILGAITANAELAKEPIYDAENVSVGYKVTGLENDEVAMVYTNHERIATWTVPATLTNVQFLVVGGGGGGGAGTWGPGGGGGGVVTGYVYQLKKDAIVNVKVGVGGKAGTSNGARGTVGGNSSIIVGETTYVLAYGGGAGRNKANGVSGGSGSGGGADSNNTTTYVGGGVTEALCNEEVIFAEPFGHKGGTNGKRAYASGGGGGAMGDGGDGSGQTGGAGGVGLEMDITGSLITYGSGGGGGGSATKGKGGTNAGNGGYTTNAATPAVANCGGGGGGGGNKQIAGSAGGSGIVVFRYVENLAPEKPVVDNLTYTGSELVGVIGDGFTVVSGTVAATEVGTYTAVLSPEGGVWADGAEGNYEVTWKILPIMTGLDINENDGYIVRGLGDGNEVAVVFTNENANVINWTVPAALNNAQFLVVGGGGGGGADNSVDSNERIAGAGGGGGGVVTGLVNFDRDTVVSVTVGAGGLGGKMSVDASGDSGYGGAYNGEASIFGVNGVAWVTADGGGSDQGASANNSYLGGKDGSAGGSGAGGRANANGGAETQGDVNSVNVTSSHKYGFPGGNGCTVANGGYGYGAAGGGGGATAAGSDGTKEDAYKGGDGGAGLTSDITGVAKVYGSGGGGSSTWNSAGIGGEGAGDGVVEGNGKNALANQGGGGGGSSRKAATGGNGGSGIVVFRFEYSDTAVASVNGYGYSNIAEAINAANGGTVTLVANVESMTLNNSLTLKTDVYSVNTVTIANENAVLITDKKLNVITTVANSEVKFENGVYSVVASVFTVALPTVENATWSYNGTPVTGPITVNKGTNVELTLSAADGYQFANGQTSVTVTFENVNDNVAADNSAFASITAPQKPAVAKIGETPYATLSAAFAAVTDDAQTVTILKDVTENLTGAYLRGNITTENDANVTITLTNSDWVYCPYTFVLGANVTLKCPALFYYAGGAQINGKLIVDAYYQRYAGTKLTINEPGSMTVTTEQFYLRYTDGDANAGIYINGDNDDSTFGLNTVAVYFYQGMINAKNANIKTSVYWQTNETDSQGSANLVLDNSKLNVTVNEQKVKATGNSTVTLTNGSELIAPGGFEVGGVLKSSCDITGAISKISDQATIEISGGTYTQDVSDWCVDGYAAVKTLDNKYVVSAMPTATISNLGSITVGLGDYTANAYMMYDIINGGKLQEATVPYDLTLAMDFKAKDTAETAAQNPFGNYTTDFFITMSGMSQASFVGDGCYLAGYYPSFKAWVKIPLDGFTVENGKVYPVITSAGFDFKYTDICGTVGQFICGIYLTPEVLAANPNLTVDLTLGLAENKDAALNAQFLKVDNYVYDVDDLVTLPEVVITDIKNTLTDADPDLTFALNFAIKDVDKLSEEYLEKLFAKYGDYYTDYVLTISGLTDPNGSVKFNANGNGDGYLAGQYDAWSTNWVTVPFSDVTVTNGQSFYIMEYAAELMNKGGLRLTLKEIAEIVKNFDCGVYFTPEFLAANPNLKVELELKVFTEDENGNKVGDISVATNTFDKDDFSVEAAKLDIRIVNGKPQIGFAGEGKLVLNAAVTLTGEWTKNISYTIVENDSDDTKTWVTPAEGYYFFKGFITK